MFKTICRFSLIMASILFMITATYAEDALIIPEFKPQKGDFICYNVTVKTGNPNIQRMPGEYEFLEQKFLLTNIVTDISSDGLVKYASVEVLESAKFFSGNNEIIGTISKFDIGDILLHVYYRKEQVGGLFLKELADKSISHLDPIEQYEGFLPETPVKIGDSWIKTVDSVFGKLTAKSTMTGFEKVRGYDCAKIEGNLLKAITSCGEEPFEDSKYSKAVALKDGTMIETNIKISYKIPSFIGKKLSNNIEIEIGLIDKKILTPEQLNQTANELKEIEDIQSHIALKTEGSVPVREYFSSVLASEGFIQKHPESILRYSVEKLIGSIRTIDPSLPNIPKVERPRFADAPDFTLKSLSGEDVRLSDFKGKIVILNFFSTKVSDCIRQDLILEEISKKYKDKGVTVIGIPMNREETSILKEYTVKQKITYPVVIFTQNMLDTYSAAIRTKVQALPTIMIINKEGKIASIFNGYRGKSIENSLAYIMKMPAEIPVEMPWRVETVIPEKQPKTAPVLREKAPPKLEQ